MIGAKKDSMLQKLLTKKLLRMKFITKSNGQAINVRLGKIPLMPTELKVKYHYLSSRFPIART